MNSAVLLLTALALILSAPALSTRGDTYRVSDAEVTVICPLTVGGSFEARTRDIHGDVAPGAEAPGTVTGAIRVNLQSLETGIALRDRHMRSNYLEVDKGSDFAVSTVDDIYLDAVHGKSTFRAILTLHGHRQEVKGAAEVSPRGGGFRVRAEFPIRVSDFQIPTPTYLGIGVRDEIRVKVSFVAGGQVAH
ncbi:MAG: YceI family protein [Acidobacteriota bacterium]